ncbi:MAG: GlxA family transcriptional regulator [Acidobacteriota bacterium]
MHVSSRHLTPTAPAARGRLRVAVVALPDCQALDVVGPLDVFSGVNQLLERQGSPRLYDLEILSPNPGRPIRSLSGVALMADRSLQQAEAPGAPRIDTLLIAGGDMREATQNERWVSWVGRQHGRVRRLGAVCTGTFLLAQAGLLEGRRATTHWAAAAALGRLFPKVRVEPDSIFVKDGCYTSAGVTAGMDLALALVEEDAGRAVAMRVARGLVIYLRRPGGQSQFSSRLAAQSEEGAPWRDLLGWMVDHLDEPLTVEALAQRVCLSPRHFSRVFRQRTGVTPAKWVERARIDRARSLLEDPRELTLAHVARRCGLAHEGALRRLFKRHLKVTPGQYRQRFTTP